jgi:glycosyltransferase involved in cell wall biosynthesis
MASAQVVQRLPGVYILLCGKGLSADNTELMGWIREEGVADHYLLLGQRDDLNQLYCAMDVLVSASAYGEGFPNVIGEAMACAVPCVVTDVGDSAHIVGDSGLVVPPRDVEALAAAIQKLLLLSHEERNQLGMAARRRIEENYALPKVVERYQNLYEEVAAQCAE